MKHCRAFFDALDDWIRRHHSVSLEPSGLFTAVWCLLQVANILEFTEADWKTYLLIPGQQHHFTVNHVKKVKSKDDLLEKLRKQKVSILGNNLDGAISKLVRNEQLPMFAPKVRALPTAPENYSRSLERQKSALDVTAIRLTRIRNDNKYIPEFQPKENWHVDTDGAEAENIVLFPHPESSATEITSPSTTNAEESPDVPTSSKHSVRLLGDPDSLWDRLAVELDSCLFAIVSIIENEFEVKESELGEWRLALARLLEHLAKIINKQVASSSEDVIEDFRKAVKLKDKGWLTMQDCAQAFLNKQPTTRHPSGKERLVFLRPSDQRTRKHFIYPRRRLANRFLGYAEKIESYFTVAPVFKSQPEDNSQPDDLKCPECREAGRPQRGYKTANSLENHRRREHNFKRPRSSVFKKNNSESSSERLCPECRDSGKPPFEFKSRKSATDHRRKKHGWRCPNNASIGKMLMKSRGNNSESQPLATKRTKQQAVRTPKKTLKVQQDDLVSSGPHLSRIHTSEEDALNEHKRVQVSDDGTRYDHPSADICGQDVTNSFEESAEVKQMESTFSANNDTNYAIPDPGSELYGNELVNELGDTNLFSALQ